MSDQQFDIEKIQPIIEQVFPNLQEIPVNSITSSIYGMGENKSIYFLIVGDDNLITPFLEDTKDEAKVKTVTSCEKSHNKVHFDLIMDFAFYFRKGKASFRVIFQATVPEVQKNYVNALKEVENLRFILMDKERKIRKVFEIDWYYFKNKKVLTKVEKNNFEQ